MKLKRMVIALVAALILAPLAGCGYNTMQANEEAVSAA